ncbi:MAG: DUF1573 domain-containing protein [Flavobacteriales bacterium]|nr:DUF1573 domain-containing protein [Flavobacteriales bacterium]
MKKLILSLVFVGCAGLFVNAQDRNEPVKVAPAKAATPLTATPQQAAAPVNPNAPVIDFKTDVIDYGTIDYNGDGLREFLFTNTGKEPLIISRAKGSCGCTVPTWPKEPIMPGETGSIKVKYATNRPGRFTKTVTISSNAKTPSKRLTIKGTVKPKPVEESIETLPVKKATDGATPIENNQ